MCHEYGAVQKMSQMLPESDNYINFWKVIISKIEHTHNIGISYQTESSEYGVSFKAITPTSDKIKALGMELDNYRTSLDRLDIKTIILVSYLFKEDQKISGFISSNQICLDCDIDMFSFKKTIHHEIFHAIQRSSGNEQYKNKWIELPEHNFNFTGATTFGEESAVIYGYMMCDSYYIREIENLVQGLSEKIEIIEAMYETACGTELVWKKELPKLRYEKHDTAAHGVSNFKKESSTKTHYPDFLPSKNRLIARKVAVLCGMIGSGLSLIAQYLEQGVKVSYSLDDLKYGNDPIVVVISIERSGEFSNISQIINSKVLWLLGSLNRHVLRETKQKNVTRLDEVELITEQVVGKWISINSEISELTSSEDCFTIPFDMFLVDDSGYMSRIFDFIGVECPEIQNIIDYDSVAKYQDAVPGIGRCMSKYRDMPIVALHKWSI